MTLEALLLLLRESILNDRSDRASGTPDYLWTDDTLVTYMNEAQRRFAVKGLILRDGSTPAATRITLVEGQTIYPLHPAVLAVVSAKTETAMPDLHRVGHEVFSAYRPASDAWVDPTHYAGLAPGAPLAYSTDEEINSDAGGPHEQITLRVYPTPSADQAGELLRLRVVRKPIELLSLSFPLAEPEIPEDHHIEMLDWAAYLALRIVDDDAGAAKRADEFRQMFDQHVRAARNTAMRKMFAPTNWGFGRNGYSWGS